MISALTGDGVEDFTAFLATAFRSAIGSTPKTKSPTCRSANSPPKLRAKSCSSGCTRSCRTSDRRDGSRTEQPDGSVRVEQTIFVERDSQKKIVIGAGADDQGDIEAARKEIGEIAETPVHLFLFVKVRENWADDPERRKMMGLE